MTGGWNGKETGSEFDGIEAVQDPFGVGLGVELQAMDDSAGAEVAGIALGVSHVVTVR